MDEYVIVHCRKLKNRVAAQAARDRRKAYMDELEDQIADLKAANNELLAENTRLRSERCSHCMSSSHLEPSAQPVISTSVNSESTSKSAVLSPQQKEQIQTLLVLMTICLISQRNSR